MHAGEIYVCRRVVRSASSLGDGRPEADDVEDAAAVRDETPVVEGRARMEDEGSCRLRFLDSVDRRARVAPLGVVAAGDHDGHRGALRDLELLREIAGEQRHEIALDAGEERLRL